MLIKNEKVL